MANLRDYPLQIGLSVVASGLLVSGFSTWYSDFYNKPNIDITFASGINDTSKLISVVNNGQVSATQFKLTVEDTIKIKDFRIFSTEGIQVLNTTNSTTIYGLESTQDALTLFSQRLANGDGSIIRVNLVEEGNAGPLSTITAYATYDQGSVRKLFQTSTTNATQNDTQNRSRDILDNLSDFVSQYSSIVGLITSGIGIFAGVASSIVTARRRRTKQVIAESDQAIEAIKVYTISPTRILHSMIEIRSLLKNDLKLKTIFPDFWHVKDFVFNENVRPMIIRARLSVVANTRDYALIDSFYSELYRRNLAIDSGKLEGQNDINEKHIQKLNQTCLVLLEGALTKIDWSKYNTTSKRK